MIHPIQRPPLRNRVDPWGQLQAVPSKASTLMGNRGMLHNLQKQITRQCNGTAWLTCELEFKGIHREVFGKGTYSELFFLDEATSFAAGHRPCWDCRRPRFVEFKAAWIAANKVQLPSTFQRIESIDRKLHHERIDSDGHKVVYQAKLGQLPSGTFIELAKQAFVLWHGNLYAWSFTGYQITTRVSADTEVTVLTPKSIVKMFASGFLPDVHKSISAQADKGN